MADILKPEELLLLEYKQQYLQYRHLDNLREKYITFFLAFVTAIFVLSMTNRNSDIFKLQILLLLLLVIGVIVLIMSISMRIVQRLTANHLMEIRKELLKFSKVLPLQKYDINNYQIGNSFLKATYTPSENWNMKERSKESAIQLIFLLIIVNSFIASYLIYSIDFHLIKFILYIKFILIFLISLFLQWKYFDHKFESEFSDEKQTKRELQTLEHLNK